MASAATPTTPTTLLLDFALQKLDLNGSPLTTQLILQLAAELGQTVNRWPGLKGEEKAALVLETLRALLAHPAVTEATTHALTPEQLAALRVVVDTVVPETLTLLVAAGRGELDFRRPTPGCFAMFCRAATAISLASVAAASSAPLVPQVQPQVIQAQVQQQQKSENEQKKEKEQEIELTVAAVEKEKE